MEVFIKYKDYMKVFTARHFDDKLIDVLFSSKLHYIFYFYHTQKISTCVIKVMLHFNTTSYMYMLY